MKRTPGSTRTNLAWRFAVAVCVIALTASVASSQAVSPNAKSAMNKSSDWGPSTKGLRLRLAADRDRYRTRDDVIALRLSLQNVSGKDYPITVGLTAEDRIALIFIPASGPERLIPASIGPRTATVVNKTDLANGAHVDIDKRFRLSEMQPPLTAGRHRLKARFTYDGPYMASWIDAPFEIESNEIELRFSD